MCFPLGVWHHRRMDWFFTIHRSQVLHLFIVTSKAGDTLSNVLRNVLTERAPHGCAWISHACKVCAFCQTCSFLMQRNGLISQLVVLNSTWHYWVQLFDAGTTAVAITLSFGQHFWSSCGVWHIFGLCWCSNVLCRTCLCVSICLSSFIYYSFKF